MIPAEIHSRVLKHAANKKVMVDDVISHRGISPRTYRSTRSGNVATIHTAAALVLLLGDVGAEDRTLHIQAHGETFIVLRASDFHPNNN